MGESPRQPDDLKDKATIVDGSTPGAASIPATIGPYKVKRPIGSGGMGTVVLAQQENPRRDVAIKIMNPGVVSRKALRRFEFEAQTLGRLQHPAIAQVYEAGTFDDGSGARPYFAMEYVSSAKELGDYVTDKKLDTKQRLELFRAACEGIEYGHRRGVIHRDLKPGNILVDAEGHPKIIDFGVARSTESDSVTATLATEAGQLIGTLQYMSPEQVELDPADLDTRSDVYALGVILYQLLVDKLPYDLTGTSLTKAAELIKHTRPERLSDINSSLKGDLETICLKTLEKDRDQRYQSVGDLSEDIRRYLADEPIMARPPTRAEQFRRLIRKNKAASVATAVVAIALIAATVISIVFATEAGRQRDSAELAKQEADAQRTIAEAKTEEVEKKAEEMQAMVNFQNEQLKSIDVAAMGKDLRSRLSAETSQNSGSSDYTGTVLELLDQHLFVHTITAINKQFRTQPLVRARLLSTMGETLRQLGLIDKAIECASDALKIYRDSLGPDDPRTLKVLNDLAVIMINQGRHADAESLLSEALRGYEGRAIALTSQNRQTSLANLAVALIGQGKYQEAEPLLRNVISWRILIKGQSHSSTLVAKINLVHALRNLGQASEAKNLIGEVIAAQVSTLGRTHLQTQQSLNSMALILLDQGKTDQAIDLYREILDARRLQLGHEHPKSLLAMHNLGSSLQRQGQIDEARTLLEESHAGYQLRYGDDHQMTLATKNKLASLDLSGADDPGQEDHKRQLLADSVKSLGESHPKTLRARNNLGVHLYRNKQYDEAEELIREALSGYRTTYPPSHSELTTAAHTLALICKKKKKYDEAAVLLQEIIDHAEPVDEKISAAADIQHELGRVEIMRRQWDSAQHCFDVAYQGRLQALGADHAKTLDSRRELGGALFACGQGQEARSHLEAVLDRYDNSLGPEHPSSLLTRYTLTAVVISSSRGDEGITAARKYLDLVRKVNGDQHIDTLEAAGFLGLAHASNKQWAESERHYREAAEGMKAVLGVSHPDTLEHMHRLGMVLIGLDRSSDAEPVLAEALEELRRLYGPANPETLDVQNLMCLAMQRQGKFTPAEKYRMQSHQLLVDSLGRDHPRTIAGLKRIVLMYRHWHKGEPDAGHDATAAKYRAMLKASEARNAESAEPAVP